MLPLKEFANFVTLHTADLAQTYVRLLKETGHGYENFSTDSCLVSARKLIKAIVEACESHTCDPLAKFFDIDSGAGLRWPGVNFPFQPLTEIECLGQTLTPVVTSLDAGKFLWQVLSEVRGALLQATPVEFTRTDRSGTSEALPGDEEKYRGLFEESRDAIFITTPEGDFIECNPAMLRLFQYTEAEIKQVRAPGIYAHPDDRLKFRQDLEQFGSVRDFELKMCKKDGTEIDCLLTATARRSQDGQAIAFHGIIRDVTEQKRNEAILAKRAGELQAVAQLSTVATSILETEQLLQEVVDLTKSSFGLYHAHIYLLDEATENLVLAAGAGEVGQQMVAQGWSIPLTQEQSLVARAARERQGVIVNDIRLEPDFLPNPLLPDTRAEMAVPLLVGQNLLGVLDVQAEVVGRFTEEDIRINTTLAVQIAAALQNARLFSQAHSSLADLKQSQNLLRSIIDATPDWIFIKDQEYRYRLANQGYANALHLLPEDFVGKNDLELGFPEELVKGNPEKGIRGFWTDDRQVMDSGEPLVNPYDPATIDGEVHIFHTIKAPVRDTAGNVTGVLAFARDTTEREHILAEMERRARRERTIRQITDKIRAATSLEELVKTAAQELGERLSAGHAVVELGIDLESKLETGSNGR